MNAKRILPPDHAQRVGGLRVMMLYEDTSAERAAMEMYQRLLSEFGPHLVFQLSVWRFDLLHAPTLMAGAVHDAVRADIIILAARLSGGLTPPIQQWTAAWVPQKRGQTAVLFAMLDHAAEGVRNDLQQAAAAAGISFLLCEINSQETDVPPVATASDVGYRLAPEGWGLND